MTDAINPKLLVLLGLAIVVAGVGAIRLYSADDATGNVGFSSGNELPIVITPDPQMSDPISDSVESSGRNPFARADGGQTFEPAEVDDGDGSSVDRTAVDGTAVSDPAGDPPLLGAETSGDPGPPAFPDPDLVGQEPSRDDPRNDTSFEG